MGNRVTRKITFRAAIAGGVIWLCGCTGGEEPQAPNFIVQDVQTGTRPTGSAAPTEAAEPQNTEMEALSESLQTSGTNPREKPPDGDGSGMGDEKASNEKRNAEESETSSNGGEIMTAQEVRLLEACTVVEPEKIAEEELSGCFFFEEIPDSVFERMQGKSYGDNCTVPRSELRYVRVLHYGFDGKVHIGELVVNRAIAQDITDIFRELFDAQYPVEKMLLIDEYGADDDASMADNNTSSFNFRFVEGTSTVSLHAYGLAVDINPLYNPYLPMREGLAEVLPENGKEYADRSLDCIYYIRPGDVCYQAFVSRGFSWGGDWSSSKDYQHFSKRREIPESRKL